MSETTIQDLLTEDLIQATDAFVVNEDEDEGEVLNEMISNLQVLAYERGLVMGGQDNGSPDSVAVLKVAGDDVTNMVASLLRDGVAKVDIAVVD